MQYLDVAPVAELKESGFLSCPQRRMKSTRDGVKNGLANSRKRGNWMKILEDKSTNKKYSLAKSIFTSKILKYVSVCDKSCRVVPCRLDSLRDVCREYVTSCYKVILSNSTRVFLESRDNWEEEVITQT